MMIPKMVDMRKTPKEKADDAMAMIAGPVSGDDYPYGLAISLGQDELTKLGLEPDCEVGDMLHIFALAKVTSVSQHQREGETSCRVELQIVYMGTENEDDEAEAEDAAEGE